MWMFVKRKFHGEAMTSKNDPRRNLHAKPRYSRSSENGSMADKVVECYKD